MTSRALAASLISLTSPRGLAALTRRARLAGPEALADAWPRLPPLTAVAVFSALPKKEAGALFALLPEAGRWLAYLAATSAGAAPLVEGHSLSPRWRRFSAAEKTSMRRALVGSRA